MTIVTRFAPSPTGYLHIGGARTALFSWLLARGKGGTFLLRIEDTDRERSTPEATAAILDSMRWLGLDWDGETVYQSAREAEHNAAVDRLLAEGKAYYCECTPEEIDAMREKARAEGRKPKYDGRCRARALGPGPGRVVRFKTPVDETVTYVDLVKGPTAVNTAEMDDLILRRSDGSPTYNLAVVVDDHDMGVTHVVRGDDHVANTPRQILLYRALGWDTPAFGHVPMILGPDKKKLSKRHGALSVMEYEKLGYLPEAVLNYLVRLGWSHGDQELFSTEELRTLFGTDHLSSSPSVFDTQKLEWFSGQYMAEADPKRLEPLFYDFLEREIGPEGVQLVDKDLVTAMLPKLRSRAKTLIELVEASRMFLADTEFLQYDEAAVKKFLTDDARKLLGELAETLCAVESFTEQPLHEAAEAFLAERGLKFKAIAQPLRVAVTGSPQGLGLFETLELLGRARSMDRIQRVLSW